jgi:pyruvate formate lyase activating enzyme
VKAALFFEGLEEESVRCLLCPHRCRIPSGETGKCGVRENRGGTLYATTYGRVTPPAMDPIEKKPLYHFLPGSSILSVGQNGCNLECAFCQNWTSSRGGSSEVDLDTHTLVAAAEKYGSAGVAYTYNEPLVGFEFVLECARAVSRAGLANVAVTNGYISAEPLDKLLSYLDALNVDIKSIEDSFYRKLCGGRAEPVLASVRRASKQAHVEVTNLIIPGENDSEANFRDLASWILDNLGPDLPVHLSAYHPAYKLQNPPTPLSTLLRAREIFSAKLNYVYLGNVRSDEGRDTVCRSCGEVLIQRLGYSTRILGLGEDGTCTSCKTQSNIVTRRA